MSLTVEFECDYVHCMNSIHFHTTEFEESDLDGWLVDEKYHYCPKHAPEVKADIDSISEK